MTKPIISVTEDMAMNAVRSFLLFILPDDVEVFKSQANRVPEPIKPDYVVMTPTNRLRLSTNVVTWNVLAEGISTAQSGVADASNWPETIEHSHSVEFDVQLDIHGPRGSDLAGVIATLIRDEYACDNIDADIAQPLYATDGHQAPFINGESQWENRWTMTAAFQIVPFVSTAQEFASTLEVTLSPVTGGLIT